MGWWQGCSLRGAGGATALGAKCLRCLAQNSGVGKRAPQGVCTAVALGCPPPAWESCWKQWLPTSPPEFGGSTAGICKCCRFHWLSQAGSRQRRSAGHLHGRSTCLWGGTYGGVPTGGRLHPRHWSPMLRHWLVISASCTMPPVLFLEVHWTLWAPMINVPYTLNQCYLICI